MSFDRLLLHYLSLSKESLSIDCYVSIPRTLRNLFQSIVSSVSLAPQSFLSIDCFISTSRSPRNFFQSIVSSVSLALIGVSFNRLLRQYQSRTLRNFFQSIVSSVSLALIGVSFNRLLRQYQSRTLRNFFQSLVIEWLRQYLSDSQDSL